MKYLWAGLPEGKHKTKSTEKRRREKKHRAKKVVYNRVRLNELNRELIHCKVKTK